jgi:hypothetical protein
MDGQAVFEVCRLARPQARRSTYGAAGPSSRRLVAGKRAAHRVLSVTVRSITGVFCRTCRGPTAVGLARCYQCDLARSQAGELLADAVAPIAYAVRGGQLAGDLWLYKTDRAGAAESATRLRVMLAAYLADHGKSVWSAAGMAAAPGAAAVVPSGRGRPGGHPLPGLVLSWIDVPLVGLSVVPQEAAHVRGVDPRWLRVDGPVIGADVLVIDDTWVSGGSAQSAAVALKLAGAQRVAIIVLGRHINPDDPRSAQFLTALPDRP